MAAGQCVGENSTVMTQQVWGANTDLICSALGLYQKASRAPVSSTNKELGTRP